MEKVSIAHPYICIYTLSTTKHFIPLQHEAHSNEFEMTMELIALPTL